MGAGLGILVVVILEAFFLDRLLFPLPLWDNESRTLGTTPFDGEFKPTVVTLSILYEFVVSPGGSTHSPYAFSRVYLIRRGYPDWDTVLEGHTKSLNLFPYVDYVRLPS